VVGELEQESKREPAKVIMNVRKTLRRAKRWGQLTNTTLAQRATPLPPGTKAPKFELHSTPDQTGLRQ